MNDFQYRKTLSKPFLTLAVFLTVLRFSVITAHAVSDEPLIFTNSDSNGTRLAASDQIPVLLSGQSDEVEPLSTIFSDQSNAPKVIHTIPGNRKVIQSDPFYTIEGEILENAEDVKFVRVRIQRRDSVPKLYWNGVTWQESAASVYQTATIVDNHWTLSGIDLSDTGDYRVQILASDYSNNRTDPSINITYFSVGNPDTTAPDVSTTTPGNRSTVLPEFSFTIQGEVIDDDSGVKSVRVRIQRRDVDPLLYWNGLEWQSSASNMYQSSTVVDDSWSLPGVDLSEAGEYRIQLLASDNSNNNTDPTTGMTFFSVANPDTTMPGVSTIIPANRSTVLLDSSYTIQGSVTDENSGVKFVRVRIQQRDVDPVLYWDGLNWQDSATNMYQPATVVDDYWSLSGVDFSQAGDYRIQLLASDYSNNRTDTSDNITHLSVSDMDTIAPSVSTDSPERGEDIPGSFSYTIYGEVTDEQSGVDEVLVQVERRDLDPRLYWNGSAWMDTPTDTYLAATVLNNSWYLNGVDISEEGEYRLQMLARDNAGNVSDPSATAVQFTVGSHADCGATHVYLLAGQSNANGQAGYFLDQSQNLPGRQPAIEDFLYTQPDPDVCYAYRTISRQTWTVDYDYGFGPLDVRYGNGGLGPNYTMGTETSLGRMLNGLPRNPEWRLDDKVCLLKFGVGGTSINSWHPSGPEGLHTMLMDFLDEKMSELEQTECRLILEDLYWIQGEADTGNLSKVTAYLPKFKELMASINTFYSFRPVFSQIKSPSLAHSPNRAIYTPLLNQKIRHAGFLTTVDNNDLTFIDQNSLNPSTVNQHYDAASYIELGRRLAETSMEN
ncbi:MAG: sialate O-acetylesterase [Granulosicoccus sp.]